MTVYDTASSVMAELDEHLRVDADHDHDSCYGAQADRAPRRHPVARAGDGDEASEETVDRDPQIPLLRSRVDEADGREPSGASGQRGVGRDPADVLPVHGRQRRARVEAVPAEPEDHATDGADGEVVGGQRATAVPLEDPPETGPKGDGAAKGDEPADGVHDGRTGEVAEHGVARPAEEPAPGVAQPAAWAP